MRLIGGNISDTPVKEIGDGSAFYAGGGSDLIPMQQVVDPDVYSITTASASVTSASTVTILAAGSNTSGVLISGANLKSYDTAPSGAWWSTIQCHTSAPGSFGVGSLFLAGLIQSTWSHKSIAMGAQGPVWVPAGYGIYCVLSRGGSPGVNYLVRYTLGANPDSTKYLSYSNDGSWVSGAGLHTSNRALNVNGMYLLGWTTNAGYGNTGTFYVVGSSGTYATVGSLYGYTNSQSSPGGGAPLYFPPGTGFALGGVSGSGGFGYYAYQNIQ